MGKRFRTTRPWMCVLAGLAGCSDCGGGSGSAGGGDGDMGGADASAEACVGEPFRCEGELAHACGDAGAEPMDCLAQGKLCDEELGCVECRAGEASCSDGKALFCRADGTLARFDCDPEQGMVCKADGCEGACSYDQVYQSYIGCDYYPTITLNPVWSGFAFAVAVSNASGEPARVLITGPDGYAQTRMVPASALETFDLPWVPALKGGDVMCEVPPFPDATRLVAQGAYRVRSDRPVTVYQFSPLQYQLDPIPEGCPVPSECTLGGVETRCLSFSNDASLLLPATALTGNYAALAWPGQPLGTGFVTVTATEDDTAVEIVGTASVAAGAGIAADGNGKVMLSRGDVLEVVSTVSSDLSGTRVRADKPVQVITGHSCANVPTAGTGTCDHIEEVAMPEETLGTSYYVTAPKYADVANAGGTDMPYVLRILALETATKVSFDPPIAPPTDLAPGVVFEKVFEEGDIQNLHVTSDKAVLVATYMVGYRGASVSSAAGIGDPSMSIAVPAEQYRKQYLFTAPVTYAVNIASIVLPQGASVRVDGKAVDTGAMSMIGASGHGVVHVLLSDDSGVHTLEASDEVGLSVYGYGAYTSYMYPGGVDLERITVVPVL